MGANHEQLMSNVFGVLTLASDGKANFADAYQAAEEMALLVLKSLEDENSALLEQLLAADVEVDYLRGGALSNERLLAHESRPGPTERRCEQQPTPPNRASGDPRGVARPLDEGGWHADPGVALTVA